MKKSLFAIAAVTAFAGAAQAQSSVTVYGILDVGYIGKNERVATGSAVNRVTSNQFGQSAETTSRLGFRGTEDLGGGLGAFFTVEFGLTPQSVDYTNLQNRQSFVGLRKKGLGNVSIGTQYTNIHLAVGQTTAGQQNNIMGDVIYPINTGLGSADGDSTTYGSSTNYNPFSYTSRTSNMLVLQSERMAGFTARLFYTMNNANNNQRTPATGGTTGYSGGKNDQTAMGLGINYNWKKLLVTANYQNLTSQNPYGTPVYTVSGTAVSGVTTSAATTTGGAAVATTAAGGSNVKDIQQYYAATYDFGILKAYAQYINRKVTSEIDSSQYATRTAQQIGVRGYITPKIEGWASAGNGQFKAFSNSAPTANFVGYQVGSNYWLSKRTNLYAIYGQTGTSNVSTTLNANPASFNASNYALGVRHTF